MLFTRCHGVSRGRGGWKLRTGDTIERLNAPVKLDSNKHTHTNTHTHHT
jgi:hypothetical protein